MQNPGTPGSSPGDRKTEQTEEIREAAAVPRGGYGRRFVANVAFGFLGTAVRFGTNMFLVGYLIRRLGREQWGLVAVAMSAVAFLTLIQLGGSAGIAKKLNTYLTLGETEVFRWYFTAGMLLCAVLAAVMLLGVVLLLTVFWSRFNISPDLSGQGRFVLGTLGLAAIGTAMSMPFFACIQAVHRVDIHAKLEMVALLIRAAAVVVLFELTTPRASTYALLLMLSTVLTLVGGWIWVRRNVPEAKLSSGGVRRGVIQDMVTFNLQVLFMSLNAVLFKQTPTLVLQQFAGLTSAGLYGVALGLFRLMRGFPWAGINALRPVVVSLEAAGRRDESRALFRFTCRTYVGLAMMMWVGLFFLRRPFLTTWLSGDVDDLVDALPWLMGAAAMSVASMPSEPFLVATERLWVPALGGVLLAAAMIVTMIYTAVAIPGNLLIQVAVLLTLFFGAYHVLRIGSAVRTLGLGIRVALSDMLVRPILPVGAGTLLLLATDRPVEEMTVLHMVVVTLGTSAIFAVVSYAALLTAEDRLRVRRLVDRLRARQSGRSPARGTG